MNYSMLSRMASRRAHHLQMASLYRRQMASLHVFSGQLWTSSSWSPPKTSSFSPLLKEQQPTPTPRQRSTKSSSLSSRSMSTSRSTSSCLQMSTFAPYSKWLDPSLFRQKSSLQSRSFSSGGGGGGQPLGNIFSNAQQQAPKPALEEFGIDLTAQIRQAMKDHEDNPKGPPNTTTKKSSSKSKMMDPIIGRHDEIRRTLQILARRTKNNPVLIGEPGVGKTAIAEGLAQRIVSGEVPTSMKDKKVIMLDVASMVAGAMYQGQFEQRLKSVLEEVVAAQGSIILFLDELHTMVGAGKGGSSGGMDMSNMLKPALARGDLQLVGATTLDEYRLYIEKDAALARRFQSVYVKEPSVEDTISILRGLKPTYELHHGGIQIKDEALVAAATLSDRYIQDRKQPDKSIDLIDEACSRLRLEQESKPEIIWKCERDLVTKQIELTALTSELTSSSSSSSGASSDTTSGEHHHHHSTTTHNDPKTVERHHQVQQQVKDLQQELDRLTHLWQMEKDELDKGKQLKEQYEKAKRELQMARQKGDFAKAGELQHSTLPELELRLMEAETDSTTTTTESKKKHHHYKMLAEAVTADAIATIIARHTGIPVSRMTGSESKKLLQMEHKLRERVIGQDHALAAVSNCVRLARTRLQAQDRTLGNFLFLGPTGVGKTELCKALAEFIFDDQDAMTRIDMSEYGEKHTVSRLIGAPPGYVGYEEGGVLTESVRRRPYQVLLLDEFEKGHRDVWNLLLQLFDEGILTDSHGRKVDFRNVIVVMTSNMGAEVIADLPPHLLGTEPQVEDSIMNVVRKTMSPELLNRIDETVIFNRLQREHMDRIAEIGIRDIAQRLEGAQNMRLDVSKPAVDVLADRGYDIRYGARPLKRTLARDLLNPLSTLVLEGTVLEGDTVQVRTWGEAEKMRGEDGSPSWICSSSTDGIEEQGAMDRNNVVILRNHKPPQEQDDEEETWDDDEFLMEDGTHDHR